MAKATTALPSRRTASHKRGAAGPIFSCAQCSQGSGDARSPDLDRPPAQRQGRREEGVEVPAYGTFAKSSSQHEDHQHSLPATLQDDPHRRCEHRDGTGGPPGPHCQPVRQQRQRPPQHGNQRWRDQRHGRSRRHEHRSITGDQRVYRMPGVEPLARAQVVPCVLADGRRVPTRVTKPVRGGGDDGQRGKRSEKAHGADAEDHTEPEGGPQSGQRVAGHEVWIAWLRSVKRIPLLPVRLAVRTGCCCGTGRLRIARGVGRDMDAIRAAAGAAAKVKPRSCCASVQLGA